MKPTIEQVNSWSDEYDDQNIQSPYRLYIAQRAAELAAAQSAERIAELERQRGKLLETIVAVSNDLAISIAISRAAIAEVRGEK